MRSLRVKLRYRKWLLAAGLSACGAALLAQPAQDTALTPLPNPTSGRGTINRESDPTQDSAFHHAMLEAAKKRNIERQSKMVSDTDRICALAQELSDAIHNGGGEAAAPATLKKMDEIGKLAKSVKDKMRLE